MKLIDFVIEKTKVFLGSGTVNELIENVDGICIKYKFKKQKYDFNHLVVVFSGYGDGSEFTYNMENVLTYCPCNVLWVKDEFFGRCSYYLCHDRDFKISHSVNKFIEMKLAELNITKDECTVVGFSKGGTAAIYFGMVFGYHNILASAPQYKLGSFVKKNRPETLKHMAGDHEDSQAYLDNIMLSSIEDYPESLNKNIYIIISPSDPDFDEQNYYSNRLNGIGNLNIFVSESEFVRTHAMVTMHNVPLILSIIYSLGSGVSPKYGNVVLKPSAPKAIHESKSKEVVVQLRKSQISGSKIYPEGVGIIRGSNCNGYGDIQYKLVLVSSDSARFEYELAKSNKPILTREFFKSSFVVYDKCWFCTKSFSGLDLSDLPVGEYTAYLILKSRDEKFERPITSVMSIDIKSNDNKYSYRFKSSSEGTTLEKINFV